MRSLKSVASIKPKTSIKCDRVYPVIGSKKTYVKDLKTVAIRLTSDGARELAEALLSGARAWPNMTITAYRKHNNLTVTYLFTHP
jgi:hypothetical protein